MANREKEVFLTVENLEVIYTSGKNIVRAVNGVSFQLRRGETLGLVGETGAGKTTIARSILQILPNPPARLTGGSIQLDGLELVNLPEAEMLNIRGKKAAMIFQDPMTALNPLMTVGEQIMEAISLHEKELSLKEASEKAGDMLELVGIAKERFLEYPHQFSGGMKQRVVIAMALACDPELLLADEPTTALDVTIQAQVLDLINELKEKFNTAMILITHDLGVVAQTCDKVAVIYAGRIVEYGTKRDVFKNPQHPYTAGLFGSLPDIKSCAGRLHPIQGMPPDPTNLPAGCAFHPRCPYADEHCRRDAVLLKERTSGHMVRCVKKGEA